MKPDNHDKKHRKSSRGIALITALLLLSLFTVMTLAMVIATSSDTLIDGYYRNSRGSFYASDSGLNAARQYLQNQIFNVVPVGYAPSSGMPNLTGTSPSAMITSLISTSTGFGANQSILDIGTTPSASSWPGKFKVDSTAANTFMTGGQTAATCTPTPSCATPGAALPNGTNLLTYKYYYQLTVLGQSRANEQNTVVENGYFTLGITINPVVTQQTSFAAYGTLLDQYAICPTGNPFVAGTMSGQFFSNDSWNFGDAGQVGSTKYIFTGSVGAHNSKVGYIHTDSSGARQCDQSSATSDTAYGTTVNPTFTGGLSLNQNKIPLPVDSSSQARAVLDGKGGPNVLVGTNCGTPPCGVTGDEMNTYYLTNLTASVWPASGNPQPTTGVYLPYTTQAGNVCPCTFSGGGIYVQGNVDKLTLAAATGPGPGNNALQVFTIKQGVATTTVTVDLVANTTTISDNSGAASKTVTGVPSNLIGATPSEAAMVYVNGNICSDCSATSTSTTGLSGPSSGPAIQNDSAVTVTAAGTISITGNITYSTEPVTMNTADTLITSPQIPTNVLGIFTPTGDIQLLPSTSGQNMQIDASIAAMSQGGTGGLDAKGNYINTLTIVGGRIANQAKQGNMSARNIWFDQRFANGFAPPFFPTATVTTTTTNTAVPQPVIPNRTSWINKTSE